MRSEEIYALAVELEGAELAESERPLEADDIFSVLEALWERGVDLGPAVENWAEEGEKDDEDDEE
jgi:hypothetical protein